jgi:hypothetical protein
MSHKEDVYLVVDSVTTALMSSSLLKESDFSYKTILEINYNCARPHDMLRLYLDILGVSFANSIILVPNFHNTSHKSKIFRIIRLLYYLVKNYRLIVKLWNKKIIGNRDSLIVQLLIKIKWASKIAFFDEGIGSVMNDFEIENTCLEFRESNGREIYSIYRPFPSYTSIPISLSHFRSSKFTSDLTSQSKIMGDPITLILFPLSYDGKSYGEINQLDWDDLIHIAVERLKHFLKQLVDTQSNKLVVYCKFHPTDYRSQVEWKNLLVSNEDVKYLFPCDYSNYQDINAIPAEILVYSLSPNYLYFMDFSSAIFSNIKNDSIKIVYDSFIWNSLNELVGSPFMLKEKALAGYLKANFYNFLDFD